MFEILLTKNKFLFSGLFYILTVFRVYQALCYHTVVTTTTTTTGAAAAGAAAAIVTATTMTMTTTTNQAPYTVV